MLPFHPYADLFPLIEGEHFDALVADVKENDVREKIVVWDGAILDGRNRYRAALAAGLIEEDDGPDRAKYFSRFVPAVDGDPLTFVISKNLNRRHLDESQRAMVAARLATMRQGERTDIQRTAGQPSANLPKVSQAQAAETLSISERTLRAARRVRDHGEPDLVRAVERGRLAVSIAEKASRLAPEIQRKIAAEAEAGNANAARTVVKREARDEKETRLAAKQQALPQKRYGLIYLDIPRHFNVRSDETGMDRAPENHYPTMTFEQTLRLPVPDLAAEDSIIVYWSTAASLIDDLEILAEWGFVTFRPREQGKLRRDVLDGDDWRLADPTTPQPYRSMQVWDKVKMGLGYWFRDRHEFIIVAARGNVVAPALGTQDQSLFSEEKGRHSAKPERVAEMIERLWPNIPKIELFARRARPGWDVWGFEAPEAPVLVDSSGEEVKHDPETGEVLPDVPTKEERTPAPQPSSEDDDLEIPAFLRKPRAEAEHHG